jgi:hypothetical protein
MTELENWLSGGDLRSDGASNQAVDFVKANLGMVGDLVQALSSSNEVVRGRAADALEKVARSHPGELIEYLPTFIYSAQEDQVAMVRWHMAMLLGHLCLFPERIPHIERTLLRLLHDPSTFVQSWAITSLCILAKQYPELTPAIVNEIAPLTKVERVALRTRAKKALQALTDPNASLPDGWIKSEHIRITKP